MRIVRHVSIGKHVTLTFTIEHCSWTGRSVTCYGVPELLRLGYRPLGKRYRLRDRFDRLIAKDAEFPDKSACNFTCCDVIGIP
jgi:hypothetical protein